jgi:hypothetical protein
MHVESNISQLCAESGSFITPPYLSVRRGKETYYMHAYFLFFQAFLTLEWILI